MALGQLLASLRGLTGRGAGGLRDVSSPGRVVLTYDDGPEPGGTEPVLAALADHGVHATFFMLVERALQHRGLVAEVLAAGHEVALHGADHRPLTDFATSTAVGRTDGARRRLEDLVQQPVRHFRPPYGALTRPVARGLRHSGLRTVLWSSDWQDWRDLPESERLRAARRGLKEGRIVLAHDGFATTADGVDDGPPPVLDRGRLSREVLELYAERGLRSVSLAEALGEPDLHCQP